MDGPVLRTESGLNLLWVANSLNKQLVHFFGLRIVQPIKILYTDCTPHVKIVPSFNAMPRIAENRAVSFAHRSMRMPSKTILIVDDELSILVPLQFLMEKEGYVAKLAQSGKEAIEKITTIRPDLILLDIMLPDLDGYEIYQMIRERAEWASIRIIFLTAKNRDADMAKGLAMGADAYITKPFSNTQLVEKIRDLIGPGRP